MNGLFGHSLHFGGINLASLGDLLLLLAAAALVVLAVRLLLLFSREGARATAYSDVAPLVQARDWHARSLRAADSGDFRRAAILLFGAALRTLNLRGLMRDEPSRTVNECRRELRARAPGAVADFEIVARTFTAALYAEMPVTAGQWEAARLAYEHLARREQDAA